MKNSKYRTYLKPAIGLMAVVLICAGNKLALSSMQAVGAAITLLFSLAVFGIGVFELAVPTAFDEIVESLKPPPAPKVPTRRSRSSRCRGVL